MGIATVDVKTTLYELIASAITTYERDNVDKDATFPYAIYALGNSREADVDNTDSLFYPLEVDVYDNNSDKDTTRVETLADSVDLALNRIHALENGFYIYLVRTSRNPDFPTADEFTYRRSLQYEARIYKGE